MDNVGLEEVQALDGSLSILSGIHGKDDRRAGARCEIELCISDKCDEDDLQTPLPRPGITSGLTWCDLIGRHLAVHFGTLSANLCS